MLYSNVALYCIALLKNAAKKAQACFYYEIKVRSNQKNKVCSNQNNKVCSNLKILARPNQKMCWGVLGHSLPTNISVFLFRFQQDLGGFLLI